MTSTDDETLLGPDTQEGGSDNVFMPPQWLAFTNEVWAMMDRPAAPPSPIPTPRPGALTRNDRLRQRLGLRVDIPRLKQSAPILSLGDAAAYFSNQPPETVAKPIMTFHPFDFTGRPTTKSHGQLRRRYHIALMEHSGDWGLTVATGFLGSLAAAKSPGYPVPSMNREACGSLPVQRVAPHSHTPAAWPLVPADPRARGHPWGRASARPVSRIMPPGLDSGPGPSTVGDGGTPKVIDLGTCMEKAGGSLWTLMTIAVLGAVETLMLLRRLRPREYRPSSRRCYVPPERLL
ncbi:uncharacterized protein DNG_08224 [Cephalotrichum gorgonifer]|uniref:Uncharacterized protein n=1 Tax=Cephalotrichum gorgonifer TaxID=2041049 RepID=A0AAE8SYY3_9PEZI|nr:uncharacterized protein DNG_08224 [Cephalotrichum gorgonifer]